MARVTINDLKNQNLTEDDVKHVTGGSLNFTKITGYKVLLGDGSVRPVESLSLNFDKVATAYKY